jgi:hypothetical protein
MIFFQKRLLAGGEHNRVENEGERHYDADALKNKADK